MPSDAIHIRRVTARSIWRSLAVYFIDGAAFFTAAFLAFQLRFDGTLPVQYFHTMWLACCVWIAAKFAFFILCGVNRGSWRCTSVHDVIRVTLAVSAGSILGALLVILMAGSNGIPRSIYILDWMLAGLLSLAARVAVRLIADAQSWRGGKGERIRTLIYGAGNAGLALLRELTQNQALMCDVIGFVDDDPSKIGLTLHGVKVLGAGEMLPSLVKKHAIMRLLIAIPSADGPQLVRIMKHAADAKVQYKMVPSLGELVQDTELGKQLREVEVEDLLGRQPVQLDMDSIRESVQGRVVMVTGAAGSIGSELCKQIANFRPLSLVGLDVAETPLFYLDREMSKRFPNVVFHPVIGNITDYDNMMSVIQDYQPSILFHAAAYKHVPLMEKHAFAAVETNIFGTWNIARAAAEHGVDDFVLISTDKAVCPTSIMGATKRVAEQVIRALQLEGGTKFVAVRFGNVLGSNGSVVPVFKEQIATGGPVTVTHPEMRRYFMTIPEAAQLVLQAFSMGTGGEVFVLEMGEPVRIADLAENLILLSGLQPGRDIEIQYTGLRPGEKMFEELNLDDENLIPTSHAKILSYVGNHGLSARQANTTILRLQQIIKGRDIIGLVLLLKKLIPDYNPGSLLTEASSSPSHPLPFPKRILTPRGRAEGFGADKLPPSVMLN